MCPQITPSTFRKRASRAIELADALGIVEGRYVYNQWVEARSSLGFVNPGDCFPVRCVGREAVDCLGRNCDRLAEEDEARSFSDRARVERKNACLRWHVPSG